MEAQIQGAARLERPEWPARQRAKLQFARYFWFARQGRFDEALECAERQVAICRDDGVEVAALFAMSNVTFMEALLGRPQEAIEHARTAIARLRELDADLGAGHLYFSEIIAQLILNRSDEALAAARNAYPRLAREGDHYRLLLPLALISALRGRLGAAARIAGFDNAVQVRSGENASVVAPLLHERLDSLLATRFSVDERAQLAAEGAVLREEDAFKLGLDAAA
jgi:tetratricopeptide (TPR) repeat protein